MKVLKALVATYPNDKAKCHLCGKQAERLTLTDYKPYRHKPLTVPLCDKCQIRIGRARI